MHFTNTANVPFTIEQWLNLARSCTVSVKADEETSASLSGVMKAAVEGRLPVWYGVTDLVNPARKYYESRFPEIPDDPELMAKFRHGNAIHDLAYAWFRGLPGTVFREVEVTGDGIGITGLKGRLDFSLSSSIVEFKTTTHEIYTGDDVLGKNPQDLEQLVTYALLTSRTGEHHYLVYHSEDYENSFRVFDVNIGGKDQLEGMLKDRMNMLRTAMDHDETGTLGRCRYYDFGCKFQAAGVCGCSGLEPLSTDVLRENVNISRNRELETELSEQKKRTSFMRNDSYSLWDLLTPRKAYLRKVMQIEGGEEMDSDTGEIIRHSGNAVFNSPYYAERREMLFKGYSLGYATMISVGNPGQEPGSDMPASRIYPSTVRINRNDPAKLTADTLSPYYLLRLSMICAISGSDTGYLLVGFNIARDQLKCFRVSFRNLGEIRSRMEGRLEELKEAFETEESGRLPECPSFLVDSCGQGCLCRRVSG